MFNPKFRNSRKTLQELGKQLRNKNNKSNSEVIKEVEQAKADPAKTTPVEFKEKKLEISPNIIAPPAIAEERHAQVQNIAIPQDNQEQKNDESLVMKTQNKPAPASIGMPKKPTAKRKSTTRKKTTRRKKTTKITKSTTS